jgi:hypothetical protein
LAHESVTTLEREDKGSGSIDFVDRKSKIIGMMAVTATAIATTLPNCCTYVLLAAPPRAAVRRTDVTIAYSCTGISRVHGRHGGRLRVLLAILAVLSRSALSLVS